ncbi:serine hydrolase [Nitrincola alkalilacustris]|uniref:serine hydrolase n=1 Tax=Nitrincola alkalilacustris TaxID=1571224 RepID=UPI00124D92D6|nr:serine hydrolase [Nitrincola alkalilacustris]
MTLTNHDTDLITQVAALAANEGIEIGFAARLVESGQQISLNERQLYPSASVFKVPVMLEVLRRIDRGELRADQRLPLTTAAKTLTTGVLLTLDDGLDLTLQDLMTLMIIISDNTATTMLLDLVGKDAVNQALHTLGCHDTTVTMNVHEMFLHAWHLPLDRPVGLDELINTARSTQMDYNSLTFARKRENTVTTAADMAHLMAMIAAGQAFGPQVSEQAHLIMRQTQTTGRVPRFLPYRSVGNKTGTFRGLRNDCGIITRADHDHIAYALFTFDPTPLPIDNIRLSETRNAAVANVMSEIGVLLYEEFRT